MRGDTHIKWVTGITLATAVFGWNGFWKAARTYRFQNERGRPRRMVDRNYSRLCCAFNGAESILTMHYTAFVFSLSLPLDGEEQRQCACLRSRVCA
jgi:hypothetical protein